MPSKTGTTRHDYYYDEKRKLLERGKKPKRLPRHIIRAMNQALTGPGFVCPICKERFRLEYGTLGKLAWKNPNQYHCKDCAKSVNFMKARDYV